MADLQWYFYSVNKIAREMVNFSLSIPNKIDLYSLLVTLSYSISGSMIWRKYKQKLGPKSRQYLIKINTSIFFCEFTNINTRFGNAADWYDKITLFCSRKHKDPHNLAMIKIAPSAKTIMSRPIYNPNLTSQKLTVNIQKSFKNFLSAHIQPIFHILIGNNEI